mgnify:CR=1 FL=1
MSEQDKLLAAEMAAVSAVKSTEIVAAASSAGELNAYQNKLDDSLDRVMDAQKTLQNLEAYEVTPEVAYEVDRSLTKAGVEIPVAEGHESVVGAESLGISLMPKDYLMTRLMGCESFLGDFYKNSREVVQRIGASFKDSYVIFTESQESLSKSLDLLENLVDTHPDFASVESFILEHRLYNLFKVNGKVSQDWVGNLTKLSSTIGGLSTNYFLNSKNVLQSTFSYFGGFAGLDQVSADDRITQLPISIPSIPFKECTYPNNRHGGPNLVAKQSVELMGGAYFYDVRQKERAKQATNVDEVKDFLIRYQEFDGTGFENTDEYTFKELGAEIRSLSSKEIKAVIKLLRGVLKDWAKVFENAEKFKLLDNDYNDVIKGFLETDISEETKTLLAKWFSSIVRKNQMELLVIRASVSNYLTLIINGLIDVCNNSIKVNAP